MVCLKGRRNLKSVDVDHLSNPFYFWAIALSTQHFMEFLAEFSVFG